MNELFCSFKPDPVVLTVGVRVCEIVHVCVSVGLRSYVYQQMYREDMSCIGTSPEPLGRQCLDFCVCVFVIYSGVSGSDVYIRR